MWLFGGRKPKEKGKINDKLMSQHIELLRINIK